MIDQKLKEFKETSFKLYLKIKNIDPEAAEYFWAKQHVEVSSIVGENKFMWGW